VKTILSRAFEPESTSLFLRLKPILGIEYPLVQFSSREEVYRISC
jgi:hypothetical protein